MKCRLATTVNPIRFAKNHSTIKSWAAFDCIDQIILIQPSSDLSILLPAITQLPPHISKKVHLCTFVSVSTERSCLPPVPDLFSLATSLQQFSPSRESPIMFLNSDIVIRSQSFFSTLSTQQGSVDISYFFRCDESDLGAELGFYLHGIDAFLLRSSSVFQSPSEYLKDFFIGLPCWDQFLPLYTSSFATHNFLRIPTLRHQIHPTSNPGFYTAQVPYLLADVLALTSLGRLVRPFLLWVFKLLCRHKLALSALHKIIIFPRLRAIGWEIKRWQY